MKKTTVIKQTYSNGNIYITADYGDGQNPNLISTPSSKQLLIDSPNGELSVKRDVIWTGTGANATKEKTLAKKFEFIKELNANDPNIGYNGSGTAEKGIAEKKKK